MGKFGPERLEAWLSANAKVVLRATRDEKRLAWEVSGKEGIIAGMLQLSYTCNFASNTGIRIQLIALAALEDVYGLREVMFLQDKVVMWGSRKVAWEWQAKLCQAIFSPRKS